MKIDSLTLPLSNDDRFFYDMAMQLQSVGYVVLPKLWSDVASDRLLLHVKSLDVAEFHPAGTGRAVDHQVRRGIRGDTIRWVEGQHPATRDYLDWIETLRLNLNRYLFLGLFDYECHYAYYPPGAFYRKHVDAFKGETNRILSTVLYLNPVWEPQDGGELVIYGESGARLETIQPTYGKFVIFLSEVFCHEVLPVRQPRYSLAGWFRVNTNLGATLDPPR